MVIALRENRESTGNKLPKTANNSHHGAVLNDNGNVNGKALTLPSDGGRPSNDALNGHREPMTTTPASESVASFSRIQRVSL